MSLSKKSRGRIASAVVWLTLPMITLVAADGPSQKAVRPFRYTVHTGDTVSGLAVKWGIPEANIGKAGSKLKVGEAITIPLLARARIRRGQSLSGLSQQYKVPIETIAKFNHLPPPYHVKKDQLILVPSVVRFTSD
jgi:LysM repeat protein